MAKRGASNTPSNLEKYPNSRQPWTTKEERFLMESPLLDRDIAKKLGRSEAAIWIRRSRIYKRQLESSDWNE